VGGGGFGVRETLALFLAFSFAKPVLAVVVLRPSSMSFTILNCFFVKVVKQSLLFNCPVHL
jgi:hypothetical protein